eukprot:jgi/Astpho2/3538/fgenesh1_pg.00057_%23_22_t
MTMFKLHQCLGQARQGAHRAAAFASVTDITDSIKNAASRIVDNVRGAKKDLKEMSGEHDSFVPDGDKNPHINKEASTEAQPFPEDRGRGPCDGSTEHNVKPDGGGVDKTAKEKAKPAAEQAATSI